MKVAAKWFLNGNITYETTKLTKEEYEALQKEKAKKELEKNKDNK